ncbi:MAG: formylglycine-generating enzyme family protein, partial [Candidatus Hydrogenedentes bacterium]|nr:formylglycine-generating enzyme family protein [Candidatus Hydrogenedentota bacterium]
ASLFPLTVRYNAGLLNLANRRVSVKTASGTADGFAWSRADNFGNGPSFTASTSPSNFYFVVKDEVTLAAPVEDNQGNPFLGWETNLFSSQTNPLIINTASAPIPKEGLDITAVFETSEPLTVVSFALNNGAAETSSRAVTLNNSCTGSPTHYMASESQTFTDSVWLAYDTAPSFTLSAGNATKTVYFRVKNDTDESAAISDTITLTESVVTEETIMLPGDVPLAMVWIPGGTFMMGRYPGEQDSYSDEDPQHPVSVPGFWMAKYELTKRQWQAVMGTTPWSGQSYVLNDLDSPAVYVSWNDSKTFIMALNSYTGKTFQLPSETEWEYACRAGTTTRFYWGDDPTYTQIASYAWYWDNQYAHVVGQKLPNAFNLYDMSGNVFEWCEDDWHSNYEGGPADGSAWTETPRGTYRIVRGGDWTEDEGCRSAYRAYSSPLQASAYVGFRIAASDDAHTSMEVVALLWQSLIEKLLAIDNPYPAKTTYVELAITGLEIAEDIELTISDWGGMPFDIEGQHPSLRILYPGAEDPLTGSTVTVPATAINDFYVQLVFENYNSLANGVDFVLQLKASTVTSGRVAYFALPVLYSDSQTHER